MPYSLFKAVHNWRQSVLHLFYPDLCVSCNAALPSSKGQCFCFRCRSRLTHTDFHLHQENAVTERLWGRVHLHSATSLYYFSKKSPVQWALHHLKYSNQPDIGRRLGRVLGRQMAQSPWFEDIEAIVPVPLHPQKERRRGYNQSLMIAQGISDAMYLPVLDQVLMRNRHTISQTQQHRMERFQNVGSVFSLNHSHHIQGKKLLLVDDVLTTGATIETCGNLLLGVPGVRLSVATIAVAMRH